MKEQINPSIISLGKNIKYYRERLNMSQGALAECSELSIQHISNIENGKVNLSMQAFVKICEALNCTPNHLFMNVFPMENKEMHEVSISIERVSPSERENLIKCMDALIRTYEKFN